VRRERWGLLAILGACLSVTAGNLISKDLLARIEPLPLVLVEVGASTLALWILAAALGRLPSVRRIPRLSIPGLFQPGLVFTLGFAGLTLVPLSIAAFLFAFETLLVLVIAWPFLGERPAARKLLLALVGCCGVALLSSGGGAGAAGEVVPALGLVLVLGAVLAAALHTVTTRAIAVDADPLAMAAASLVAGLAVIAAALSLWPPADWDEVLVAGDLLLAVVAGLLLHGSAMIFFNLGLARVSAGTVAIVLPAIAPMTAGSAYVLFGERPGALQWIGGGLVLAAAVAVGLLGEPGRRPGAPR
jgi:probable blue pigment (indigoidine) exporter